MGQIIEFVSNNLFLFIALLVVLVMVIKAEYEHQTSKAANLSTAQATRLLNNNPEALVLDIRKQADFDDGHIKQATNVPLAELKDNMKTLLKYKDMPVLIYCNSGNTTFKAVKTLQQNGFDNVNTMQGGIAEWKEAGLPLTKK